MFSCEYCEISKNAFYGTPPVATSVIPTLTDVKSDTIIIQDRCTNISNKNSNPEDIAKAIGSLELRRFANKKVLFLSIAMALFLKIYGSMTSTFLLERNL